MGKFSGWMIVTDLDGTLLRDDKSVSEENLRAIRYFQSEGGLFSFITGRIPRGAKAVVDVVHPNAPCGHNSGGCLYDHRTGQQLWGRSISAEVAELVDYAVEQVPSVGVIACTHSGVYFHKKNAAAERFRRDEGFEDVAGDIRTVQEPLAKVMFTEADEATLQRLIALLEKHPLAQKFTFLRTDKAYYEALPQGVGKGDLLPRLSKLTGVPVKHIIAVGDNDNDVSMLRAAGLGVAVANASQAAKAAADRITVSNEEHAIARVIEEW
ncbi:MAG: Cof-type HAD-IIB family hydrolase [Clostridia bacterium]|nr:Cof-type HAD-IIB family hydrolase [Clostridia bacterium]